MRIRRFRPRIAASPRQKVRRAVNVEPPRPNVATAGVLPEKYASSAQTERPHRTRRYENGFQAKSFHLRRSRLTRTLRRIHASGRETN